MHGVNDSANEIFMVQVFSQLAVGLGSSEQVILIPKTKNVLTTEVSSNMAMIRCGFALEGHLQRSSSSKLK